MAGPYFVGTAEDPSRPSGGAWIETIGPLTQTDQDRAPPGARGLKLQWLETAKDRAPPGARGLKLWWQHLVIC